MQKMVDQFGGDYQVMRVCFANSDPLQTFMDLHDKISIRKFLAFVEYLDAKATIDFESAEQNRRKMVQQAEAQQKENDKRA